MEMELVIPLLIVFATKDTQAMIVPSQFAVISHPPIPKYAQEMEYAFYLIHVHVILDMQDQHVRFQFVLVTKQMMVVFVTLAMALVQVLIIAYVSRIILEVIALFQYALVLMQQILKFVMEMGNVYCMILAVAAQDTMDKNVNHLIVLEFKVLLLKLVWEEVLALHQIHVNASLALVD